MPAAGGRGQPAATGPLEGAPGASPLASRSSSSSRLFAFLTTTTTGAASGPRPSPPSMDFTGAGARRWALGSSGNASGGGASSERARLGMPPGAAACASRLSVDSAALPRQQHKPGPSSAPLQVAPHLPRSAPSPQQARERRAHEPGGSGTRSSAGDGAGAEEAAGRGGGRPLLDPEPEPPGCCTCWHEVTATGLHDPVSGAQALLLVQVDVTARVAAEQRIAQVLQAEHKLLESVFPR